MGLLQSLNQTKIELTFEMFTAINVCIPAGRQSPELMVWHLGCAEQASVPLHCVDPSCTHTAQCSTPAVGRVSYLQNNNRFCGVIFNWV